MIRIDIEAILAKDGAAMCGRELAGGAFNYAGRMNTSV
jgi:hypothetical protein